MALEFQSVFLGVYDFIKLSGFTHIVCIYRSCKLMFRDKVRKIKLQTKLFFSVKCNFFISFYCIIRHFFCCQKWLLFNLLDVKSTRKLPDDFFCRLQTTFCVIRFLALHKNFDEDCNRYIFEKKTASTKMVIKFRQYFKSIA